MRPSISLYRIVSPFIELGNMKDIESVSPVVVIPAVKAYGLNVLI